MRRTLVALVLVASCAAPVPAGDDTALRTLPVPTSVPLPVQADPGAYEVPTTIAQRRVPTTTRASRSRRTPHATAPATKPPTGDIWWRLALCESGGNPKAVSASGRYRGAFQFSLETWRSLGMAGDPIQFDYGTQLIAAKRLQVRSGWGQWPSCSRQLGLR